PAGKIMGATGTLVLDTADPTRDAVDIALDMNTLTTGLPDFDTQLKGKDYFDVAQFPQATFKSTKVEITGDTTANVTGDLTIHGKTQSVVLAVTFTKKAFNPAIFKTGYGFTATAHIDPAISACRNTNPLSAAISSSRSAPKRIRKNSPPHFVKMGSGAPRGVARPPGRASPRRRARPGEGHFPTPGTASTLASAPPVIDARYALAMPRHGAP